MRPMGVRMTEDDNGLACKAAGGDREAFRSLVERHYDRVFRIALGVVGNSADAEDITQDVWAAMPSRLKSWRSEARFTTWLHKVALNAARDALRRSGARARSASEMAVIVRLQLTAVDNETEQSIWLENALLELRDDLRETAALVVGEGLSHKEAAQLLGVAEATISWRMMEIRKRLQAKVSKQSADEETAPPNGKGATRRLRPKEQPG